MKEKRSKGLCLWCGEKYSPGHVCKKRKQLLIIDVDEEGEEWESEGYTNREKTAEESTLNLQVSIAALDGSVDS